MNGITTANRKGPLAQGGPIPKPGLYVAYPLRLTAMNPAIKKGHHGSILSYFSVSRYPGRGVVVMAQLQQPVRPRNSIPERAKDRNRKPGKWHNLKPAYEGRRKKRKPVYLLRTDGQPLFYHGKENAIYSETEAGKDHMLALLVCEILEDFDDKLVAWIDFEESDEIDIATRLIELGLDKELACDRKRFLYATPEDIEQAKDAIYDAIQLGADIIILNGVQAAYSLFGWSITEPNSAALFRNELVRRCLNAGRTVIETDHVTKADAEGRGNGSRYASGTLAKLNWVSGAAYSLRARTAIVKGSSDGSSALYLTKDRPGGIKPSCESVPNDPKVMYAGTLHVKSSVSKDGKNYSLHIEITPPLNGDAKQKIDSERQEDIRKTLRDHGPMSPTEIAWELWDYEKFPSPSKTDIKKFADGTIRSALRRGDGSNFTTAGGGKWKNK